MELSTQTLLLTSLLFVHWLMVFGLLWHPRRLRKFNGDVSHDPYYRPLMIVLGYLPIALAQGWGQFQANIHEIPQIFIISGSIIFAAGVFLRIWAIQKLDGFFSMELGLRRGHELKTSGPYRLIRHPSYSGYLLMVAGLGIAYASWIAFLIPLLETVIFQIQRIWLEEKMLLKHFGPSYAKYQKDTWKLIPYIY